LESPGQEGELVLVAVPEWGHPGPLELPADHGGDAVGVADQPADGTYQQGGGGQGE
jgi:hypothetical protein